MKRFLVGAAALACLLGAMPFAPIAVRTGEHIQDPTVTPDGRTMYVTIASKHASRIVTLRAFENGWRSEGTVSFSGTWRDLEEVLTPDDSAMIFASNRPLRGAQPLDAYYNGRYGKGFGGNLWIVRRSGNGWGVPQPLPPAINANTSVFSPAVSSDGTLFFMRATGKQGHFHLFVSTPPYASAELAPFTSATAGEFDPTVSPDGRVVIFSSTRAPVPKGETHLFIASRSGDAWSLARDLGPTINGPGAHNIEARILPGNRLYYNAKSTLYCIKNVSMTGRILSTSQKNATCPQSP